MQHALDSGDYGQVLGKRIYRYKSVTSTNDVARTLALKHADEGTTVVAAEQTSGRGSRGRTWLGGTGENLLISVLMRPNLKAVRMFELAFVAAVAVADYLIFDVGLPARVKWPNDVCVRDKKIAGILIESIPLTDDEYSAIVGVGMNVNWAEMPGEIAETGTSIQIELGRTSDIEPVLQGVLTHLNEVYSASKREGFHTILSRWRSLECSTGSTIRIDSEGIVTEGRVESVDSDGALVVRLPDGEVQRISAMSLVVGS